LKVLLIGCGAREHAIAEALHSSELYAFTKNNNPGITRLAKEVKIGDECDANAVSGYAIAKKVDFVVVGPEAPLAAGVVDACEEKGVQCVGPRKALAQLETSKSFARLLLQKHGIPGNPEFQVFNSTNGLREYLEKLSKTGFVVKPDGLTGGKGVKVSGEHLQGVQDAFDYCVECIKGHGKVVVEEKLEGEEFSLQALVSGEKTISTPIAQDHKRAFEGDEGPNTGGMGSYSCEDHSLPFLSESDVKQAKEINAAVAKAILEETNTAYKGVLYGGFMATANGVKLIEYNVRFGDPEAMNVLPIITSDFSEVCAGIADGSLSNALFAKKATVVKYAVPEGYPANPQGGKELTVDESNLGDARLYYSSVNEENGKIYSTRSRSIAALGIADSLSEAEEKAQAALNAISGPVFHRKDIGTRALLDKRISHMKALRG
jgi:phosphoribosylamine--glycine ligase